MYGLHLTAPDIKFSAVRPRNLNMLSLFIHTPVFMSRCEWYMMLSNKIELSPWLLASPWIWFVWQRALPTVIEGLCCEIIWLTPLLQGNNSLNYREKKKIKHLLYGHSKSDPTQNSNQKSTCWGRRLSVLTTVTLTRVGQFMDLSSTPCSNSFPFKTFHLYVCLPCTITLAMRAIYK